MSVRPIPLLRLEATVAAAVLIYVLYAIGARWEPVVFGLILPDLSLLLWRFGAKIGATAYNLAHFAAIPLVGVAAYGLVETGPHSERALALFLAWLLHISIDRALGFGLKGPDGFRDTHLGRIGG